MGSIQKKNKTGKICVGESIEHPQIRSCRGQTPLGWLAISGGVTTISLLVFWLVSPGDTVLEHLRWLDSGICAQLVTHTLVVGGKLLPLCARNTGIYLGYLITWSGILLAGRGRAQHVPPRGVMTALVCGVLLCIMDGTNSWLHDLGMPHLYQPQNVLRLASGLLTGLAMAAFLLPQQNGLLWNEYNEQTSLPSWTTPGGLLLAGFCCVLTIICQWNVFLYPIAFLSTAGLVMAISNFNLVLILALGKRDQMFTFYRELLPFYSLAILCSISELALLAQAKLFLMQTLGIYL